MFNILSYVGVNLQAELCFWTLLGLIRTIFDATLFKVNADLKQVWQMAMPAELSMAVQRGLRTMISGIMLLQCFSVYVYLAAYIVLLYPVFFEERPALLLPWLLLAAIRRLLCELTSLALGLGTCLLLGPAKPACVRFLICKISTITPAFYMWMLVFSYYNTLKVMSKFRTPVGIAGSDHDYGLELAVRRRRTKSLQQEEFLRRKLVASLHGERMSADFPAPLLKPEINVRMVHSATANSEDIKAETQDSGTSVSTVPPDKVRSDIGSYEDWFGSEIVIPRDTDRILEQFAIMMLRIGVYLKSEGKEKDPNKFLSCNSIDFKTFQPNLECSNIASETETPPHVASNKGRMASYLQNYPQIFMKKPSSTSQNMILPAELLLESQLERERSQTMLGEQLYSLDFPKSQPPTENYDSKENLESGLDTEEREKETTIDKQKQVKLQLPQSPSNNAKKYKVEDTNVNKSNKSTQISDEGTQLLTPKIVKSDKLVRPENDSGSFNATTNNSANEERSTESDESLQGIIVRMKQPLRILNNRNEDTRQDKSTEISESLEDIIDRMKHNLPRQDSSEKNP